jgi:hypothetical protein
MMQRLHTTTPQPAATRPLTASDRLESARTRVRFALCCADDGEPTFATLDAISRALVAATSELSQLAVELETYTYHERKVS